MLVYDVIDGPLGELVLTGDGERLTGVRLGAEDDRGASAIAGRRRAPAAFAAARGQLTEYLAGRRAAFDLALGLRGTPFQRAVWAAVMAIPYGATATYGELAARLGRPAAARAVGHANAANPVAIVVPCHRVLGARGALTGYAYGLERKAWLLALERRGLSPG
jgi:methylated-DNA-[protein]-cysteine S-methyltransferase